MSDTPQHAPPLAGMSLFDAKGKRKYLTGGERKAFIEAAAAFPAPVRTFCTTLAYTGCRISEALELTADRVDFVAGSLVFETLKKRRSGVYRAVPVPPTLLDNLELVHGLRKLQKSKRGGSERRIWGFDRKTGYRYVCQVMEAAGVRGPQASPKGLRHAFGIAGVEKNIPLNMLQKWMGHAQPTTTAIYLNAVGAEEQNLAARMWS